MHDPEPKTQWIQEHVPLGKESMAELLLPLCFGNCKGPQGHILVLAPLLSLMSHASITCSLQQLAHTCLTPCEVPWPCTVVLGTHDTMESPQLPPVCPLSHSLLQEASRVVCLMAPAQVTTSAHLSHVQLEAAPASKTKAGASG